MKYFIINSPVVPIYKSPKFESELITQALLGETCVILKTHNNWIYIQQWDKYEGWAHSFYGISTDTPYKTSHTFRKMEGYSKNEKGVKKIIWGSKLQLTSSNRVLFPDGWKGSTPKGFYKRPLAKTRENIINEGKRLLGTPYLWGGKSSLGIDCSGLIQTVFRSLGISLPRDAWEQAEYFLDNKNTLEEIKIGDLLFFGNNPKISHVAIYSGQTNFLHSQGWVKEESLNKFHSNFNEKLFNLLQFSVSVEHELIS